MRIFASDKSMRMAGMFGIKTEQVYRAMLEACGCTDEEAYLVTHPEDDEGSKDAMKMRASREKKEYPHIQECVDWLKSAKIQPNMDLMQTEPKKSKYSKPKPRLYNDKDYMLSELYNLSQMEKDPTKRAAILKQIADLQQMKKDENKDEAELIHFYLPLKCHACELYIQNKRKQEP